MIIGIIIGVVVTALVFSLWFELFRIPFVSDWWDNWCRYHLPF